MRMNNRGPVIINAETKIITAGPSMHFHKIRRRYHIRYIFHTGFTQNPVLGSFNPFVFCQILDEVFGIMGWKRQHVLIGGNLYCIVSIWDEGKQQWIDKMDESFSPLPLIDFPVIINAETKIITAGPSMHFHKITVSPWESEESSIPSHSFGCLHQRQTFRAKVKGVTGSIIPMISLPSRASLIMTTGR